MNDFSWHDLAIDSPICAHCFAEMQPREHLFKVGHYEARCLYEYNEKIRSLLYQLKGCKDVVLASIFIANQGCFLKKLYRGYSLVCAPSYKEKDLDRGFNHVHEIFLQLGLPYIEALEKIDDVKQADCSFEERLNIGKHIRFRKDASVRGLKILFVDDLITTGSTAKACCDLLVDNGAKKVQILAMGHTMKKENGASPKG